MTDSLLTSAWGERLALYSTLYVGFSGGLDSTVLLHALASQPLLRQLIHAVHINHGLSPYALEWELHGAQVCHDLGVTFSAHRIELSSTSNLEESARIARYSVFHSLIKPADALLLAHHQDDQAETLLLNLMRGAGIDGMAAMLPAQPMTQGDLIRPLLTTSRAQIEAYARVHGLSWVEDESNQQEHFSRNYIRHRIMPLLNEQWPAAAKSIARGAAHCQQAKKNLEALAEIDGVTRTNQLAISAIKHLPRERLLNVLRTWIQYNGYQRPSEKNLHRLIDELIVARQDSEPMVSFGEAVIRRYQDDLYCLPFHVNTDLPRHSGTHSQHGQTVPQIKTLTWSNFPNPLDLGSQIGTLYTEQSTQGLCVPATSRIDVRFRTGGESFRWHGQTKSLKKLLQQWHVPPWERDRLPLIYVDETLAVIVGYAVSDDFYAMQKALTIRLQGICRN